MGDFLICGQGLRTTHGGARRGSGVHNPHPPSVGLGSLVIRSSKGLQGGGLAEQGGFRKQTPDIWKSKVLKEPLYSQLDPFVQVSKGGYSVQDYAGGDPRRNASRPQALLSRNALEPHDATLKKSSSKPWRDILLREMVGEQSSKGPQHSGHELARMLTNGHGQQGGKTSQVHQEQPNDGYGPTTKSLRNYRNNTGGSIHVNMTGSRAGIVDVATRSSLSSLAKAAAGYQSEPASPRRENTVEGVSVTVSEGGNDYFEESSMPLQNQKIDRNNGIFPRISSSERNNDPPTSNIESLSGQKDIAAAAAFAQSLKQQYAMQVAQSQQLKQRKEASIIDHAEQRGLPQKREDGSGWLTKLAEKEKATPYQKQGTIDTSMISAYALARTRCVVSNGEIFQYQQGRKVPISHEKFQTLLAAADAQAAAERISDGQNTDSNIEGDLCIQTTKVSINRHPVDERRNQHQYQSENECEEENLSCDDSGESSGSDDEVDEEQQEDRQERISQGTEDGESTGRLSKPSSRRKRRRAGRTKRKTSTKTSSRSRSQSVSKPFDPEEDKRLAMKRLKESAAKVTQSQEKLMEAEQVGHRTRKFQPVDPEEEKRKAALRASEYQKHKQSSKALERPEEKIEAERRNKRKMSETMNQLAEAAKGQRRAEVYALNRIMKALEERKFEKYKNMMDSAPTDAISLGFKCETAPS